MDIVTNINPASESVFDMKYSNPKMNKDEKFTAMFLLLAGYMLWTYSVMPDIQTSIVAIQTGVNKSDITKLWILSLIGTGVFFYALYSVGQLPE